MTSTAALAWIEAVATIQAPDAGDGTIGLGAPFRLEIVARHPKGGIALLPSELDLGAFGERTSARTHRRLSDGAAEIDHYELELVPFETGDHSIPRIELAFGSTIGATSPISVVVRSGLTEDEAKVATSTLPQAIGELETMAVLDPPSEVIRGPDYALLYALAGAVVLLASIVLLRRLMARRKVEVVPPPPPPRPAHEVARERLAGLDAMAGLEDLKPFFIEVSEILRAYVGSRYRFDSLDLTVGELMAELERRETRGLDRIRLEALLSQADLVKFAKYGAVEREAREALETAKAIVDATAEVSP
jgi:hypothetical protein